MQCEVTNFWQGYIGGWELLAVSGLAIFTIFLLMRSLGTHHDDRERD